MENNKNNRPSQYLLYRQPIQEKQISIVYNAKDKNTGEIWMAKVIDMQLVKHFYMEKQIEFNRQVFLNLQNSQHFVQVREIFQKQDNLFFIQEVYQHRLSNYIQKQGYIKAQQNHDILIYVFAAICDLYQAKYIHRCLRSQCVVQVNGMWKLESVVYTNKNYRIQSQFCWNDKFASKEDKDQCQNLSELQLQSQIVWQMGMMGIEMALGNNFVVQKRPQDTLRNLDWQLLNKRCTKQVYQMIRKSIKLNIQQRITLNNFLKLKLFQNVIRNQNIHNNFLTASKIYKNPQNQLINQFSNHPNPIVIKLINKVMQTYQYYAKSYYYTIEKHQKQGQIALITYLFDKISYERINNIILSIKGLNQNQQYAAQFLSFFRSNKGKQKLNQLQKIQLQLKTSIQFNVRLMNQKCHDISIVDSSLLTNINEDTSYQQILRLFGKAAGKIYMKLKNECDQRNFPNRNICYFSYAVILTYLFNQPIFKELNDDEQRVVDILEYVEKTDINILVSKSQFLIRQYFKVENQKNQF